MPILEGAVSLSPLLFLIWSLLLLLWETRQCFPFSGPPFAWM